MLIKPTFLLMAHRLVSWCLNPRRDQAHSGANGDYREGIEIPHDHLPTLMHEVTSELCAPSNVIDPEMHTITGRN